MWLPLFSRLTHIHLDDRPAVWPRAHGESQFPLKSPMAHPPAEGTMAAYRAAVPSFALTHSLLLFTCLTHIVLLDDSCDPIASQHVPPSHDAPPQFVAAILPIHLTCWNSCTIRFPAAIRHDRQPSRVPGSALVSQLDRVEVLTRLPPPTDSLWLLHDDEHSPGHGHSITL
ncbi:uncharacterized protein K460DRAFT_368036 [Cucurbitaria berberidis CBS 394.84]|uniref:Uncharacterized protein n=1 Tax=Cucurbitaria berberidis CBS 394.84 TaxID=1168544 RepID=A0A9P4L6J1_9PLEO|nr:uncharacterized protein K460DRAFT_368036 [Cucurbitaria berberidis CBS 394.84]KAF1843113.1 hypothetical protein K460DRAFT_368036 [Cucurbitaria berberidis CBS 394.84]